MIDTRTLPFPHWASQTTLLINQYGQIPIATKEEEWRGWAAIVSSLPAFASVGASRPERFEDWRSWGTAFNQAARLLGL